MSITTAAVVDPHIYDDRLLLGIMDRHRMSIPTTAFPESVLFCCNHLVPTLYIYPYKRNNKT